MRHVRFARIQGRSTRLALALLAALPASAAAQAPQEVDAPTPILEWRAAAGCPGPDALRAAVMRNFNNAIPATRVSARARVWRVNGPQSFRLRLSVENNGRASSRELAADQCEALLESAALVISLAIDPDFAATEPVETDPTISVDAVAAPDPASTSVQARPAVEAPSEERPNLAEDAATEASAREALRLRLGASAFMDYGTLPSAVPGVELRGQLGRASWQVGVGFNYTFAGHVERDASLGADVSRAGVPVWTCTATRPSVLVVQGCAGLEGALLFAAGAGNAAPTRVVAPTIEGFIEGRLVARISTSWLIGLSFLLAVPMVRPRFTIDDLEIYRPAALRTRAAVFVEFEL